LQHGRSKLRAPATSFISEVSFMPSPLITRRAFAVSLAAIPVGLKTGAGVFGAAGRTGGPAPGDDDGLTHTSEAIHQEVTFGASRRQVYAALTETKRFDDVTRLSDGKELLAAPEAKPTAISDAVGGPFVLFGGYITGRHLELTPGERLVQAWRAASWKPGEYSIVTFVLHDEGPKTRLVFDHRGFPDGTGSHLASGWHAHYWDPLTKYFAG
jgi:activator of HSP90 ATPase